MSDHKIYMLQQIRECNKKLQERIDELDKRIKAIMEPYSWMVEKLCEIPDIQDRVCEDLIAEIGLEMGNFPTSAHLCPGQECVRATTRAQERRRAAGPATETSM